MWNPFKKKDKSTEAENLPPPTRIEAIDMATQLLTEGTPSADIARLLEALGMSSAAAATLVREVSFAFLEVTPELLQPAMRIIASGVSQEEMRQILQEMGADELKAAVTVRIACAKLLQMAEKQGE